MRKVKTQTADDGTELEIKQRNGGDYIVTERGSGERTGQVVQSREAAERQLKETSRLYGVAEDSQQRDDGGSMLDSGFGSGLTGGFGSDMSMGRETDDNDAGFGVPEEGGLFGGDDMDIGFGGGMRDRREADDRSETADSEDSGGLFGSGGGLFGGGGSTGRKRDPDTGKFAPSRPQNVDFEMERNEDGTFSGRKDSDDSDGMFGFLR